MRKIKCAGCDKYYPSNSTSFYRNKRWCHSESCKLTIDEKVKNFNYKKRQKKIESGKYRNGVTQELRMSILHRDSFACKICGVWSDQLGVMQVHHIIPVSHGGDDCENNLICLCRGCHIEVHNDGWEKYVSILEKAGKSVESTYIK